MSSWWFPFVTTALLLPKFRNFSSSHPFSAILPGLPVKCSHGMRSGKHLGTGTPHKFHSPSLCQGCRKILYPLCPALLLSSPAADSWSSLISRESFRLDFRKNLQMQIERVDLAAGWEIWGTSPSSQNLRRRELEGTNILTHPDVTHDQSLALHSSIHQHLPQQEMQQEEVAAASLAEALCLLFSLNICIGEEEKSHGRA